MRNKNGNKFWYFLFINIYIFFFVSSLVFLFNLHQDEENYYFFVIVSLLCCLLLWRLIFSWETCLQKTCYQKRMVIFLINKLFQYLFIIYLFFCRRTLSRWEKRKYIEAVKCLTTKPARSGINGTVNLFDDFIAVHSHQTPHIHFVVFFFFLLFNFNLIYFYYLFYYRYCDF